MAHVTCHALTLAALPRRASNRSAMIGEQFVEEVGRYKFVRVNGEYVEMPFEEVVLRACAGEQLWSLPF